MVCFHTHYILHIYKMKNKYEQRGITKKFERILSSSLEIPHSAIRCPSPSRSRCYCKDPRLPDKSGSWSGSWSRPFPKRRLIFVHWQKQGFILTETSPVLVSTGDDCAARTHSWPVISPVSPRRRLFREATGGATLTGFWECSAADGGEAGCFS